MLQKDNRYRALQLFFNDPAPQGGGFQLREISRSVNIAPPSVKKYLVELEADKLIVRQKHRIYGYPTYFANKDGEDFRFLKKIDTMQRINESGLLGYLTEACAPDVVILFGSSSRGEDGKESEVNIFLQCEPVKLNVGKYEKELGRKINPVFGKIQELKELRNEIMNGSILKGYVKVF